MRSLGSSQNKDIELANKAGSGLQPSMCTGHGSDPREWAGEADETESGIERARSSGARARGGVSRHRLGENRWCHRDDAGDNPASLRASHKPF